MDLRRNVMTLWVVGALGAPALAALVWGADPAASAQGRSLQLPALSLPTATSGPRILARAADLDTLRSRKTLAPYAAYYTRFKSNADGALATASFPTLGDDRLAQVAKAAALLEQLGDVPPGTRFTRYRDVAVLALKSLTERAGRNIFGSGSLDPIQDAGRLQSMVEAHDLLRGTGVSGADDTAIRARVADWCAAFLEDQQLPFQVNNYQLKSGAALVSAAMALWDHPNAQAWLTTGVGFVNAGLEKMASSTGWYREGVHYLNYSLNNLVSAAYAVRNATGVDWFTPLRPLVRFAIDTRLPDGSSPPFEEGVSNVFPYHVLLGPFRADAIAREMAWAWAQSSKQTGNYENQQLHDATAFVVHDASLEPLAPTTSPTRFFGGDASYSVLRENHTATARQASLFAALDHSNSELITSRHNTRNPLDLVISAAGQNLLPTSGGGPQVTNSANRAYYLDPASKNVPLVGGTAPFLMDPAQVEVRERIDTHDATGAPGALDLVTTATTAYGGAGRVSRTVAMIAGEYFVVMDAVSAPTTVAVSIPWHGRGARNVTSASGAPLGATWTFQGSALELAAVASRPAVLAQTSGYYAETFGQEEAIAGVRIDLSGSETRILSLLAPRLAAAPGRTVVDLSSSGTAAMRVETGGTRDLFAAAQGASLAAGTLAATCSFAFLRETSGEIEAFAASNARSLSYGGRAVFAASVPVTFVAALGGGELHVELSQDNASTPVLLTFADLPTIDLSHRFGATFRGLALDATQLAQNERGFIVSGLSGGGSLRISSALPPPLPPDGGPDGGATLPDGGATLPDGGATLPDGGATLPDAGIPATGCASADTAPAPDLAALALLWLLAWLPAHARRRRR